MTLPSISIIIPFYRDLHYFEQCLISLRKQTLDKDLFKIFVIDNHPAPINLGFPETNIEHIHEPNPGSYSARNAGLRQISEGIVAFTDADCLPAFDWLEKGIEYLMAADNKAIIAGNIKLFPKDSDNPTIIEDYDLLLGLRQRRFVEKYKFAATANMLLWRSAFDEVGYFNQDLKSGGDREWGIRAYSRGYKYKYCDDVIVYHPARCSIHDIVLKTRRVRGGLHDSSKSKCNLNIPIKEKIKLSINSLLNILTDRRLKFGRKIMLIIVAFLLYIIQGKEYLKLMSGRESER